MTYWNAHYADALHEEAITIVNEEADKCDNLSFTIDGVTFQGGGLSSFELKDPAQYAQAKERFALLKWGGHDRMTNIDFPYVYGLQRYALQVQIPVRVVRTGDGSELDGVLEVGYRCVPHDREKVRSRTYCDEEQVWEDDVVVTAFRLTVDGQVFSLPCDSLWFDTNLQDLCRMMGPKYSLRCCYTCQWSDYSPYGADDFGTMLCYRDHKTEYRKVNSKADYFNYLGDLPCDQRQETYLCTDFTPRDQCGGYRGFVEVSKNHAEEVKYD